MGYSAFSNESQLKSKFLYEQLVGDNQDSENPVGIRLVSNY
jgi:hypothetical protein